jgi:uncharacterized protein YndB with AHSA1/START domain
LRVMDDDPTVTREIELDAPPEEVWPLLADDDERATWLGDGELDLSPGGHGHVDEPDGSRREVRVAEVEPERRLRFDWWTTDDDRSRVEIVLVPTGAGTRFVVTETRCSLGHSPTLRADRTFAARALELELAVLCRRAGVVGV